MRKGVVGGCCWIKSLKHNLMPTISSTINALNALMHVKVSCALHFGRTLFLNRKYMRKVISGAAGLMNFLVRVKLEPKEFSWLF